MFFKPSEERTITLTERGARSAAELPDRYAIEIRQELNNAFNACEFDVRYSPVRGIRCICANLTMRISEEIFGELQRTKICPFLKNL